ncbi:hypothetical protein [Limnohabitans sp. Rim8]|uniref:hypothetical protein n=1 Tax=Limnohabitans sp. Rim8 TaxID=1100718 RepID=UPI0025E532C7|nr:hypothetical protein [Limnohabitans sp. Rim8]
MKKYFILLASVLLMNSSIAIAASLAKDDPIVKQLEAMGYEVKPTENNRISIATLGQGKVLFDKNNERISIFRMFNLNKKPTGQNRLEFLEILNEINVQSSYQVSLEGDSMIVCLYKFGPYDAKTLTILIRLIEQANKIFDDYPKLIELSK